MFRSNHAGGKDRWWVAEPICRERIGFIGKRNVDKRKRLHFRGAGLFEGRFFEMGT